MNKTVSVGALLVVILTIGLLAASAIAYNNYDLAQRNGLRAQALNDQLWQANKELTKAKEQLKDTQSQLAYALSQLGQKQVQLSQEQRESQRRLGIIFSQQENVRVLKSCLAGVALDDAYFRNGVDKFFQWADSRDDDDYYAAADNFRRGKEILDRVRDDCKKAYELFQ